MIHQSTTYFGEASRAVAQALYDAGQTDTEIALSLATSVNNIIHWRRDLGLSEIMPAAAPEKATREPVRSRPPGPPPSAKRPSTLRPALAVVPVARPAGSSPPPVFEGVSVDGENPVEIGADGSGRAVSIDLDELLTTRLLVQGNSGSGKSHLLRKVIEETAGVVQQIILDPEGDFAGLAETFGHTVIDAAKQNPSSLAMIGARVRRHRGSVVLNMEELDTEQQMDCVSAFLTALFEAPREQWTPARVFVDEAQLFAPASTSTGDEGKESRKASLSALTNLMCRGRKRGLAGVLATQRIAKLHKNVAAEASNFLMGRTFLDVDMARAADLLGMAPKSAEVLRDLGRGEFLGLGPAIARRPLKVKIGSVLTAPPSAGGQGLVPLPSVGPEEMGNLILAPDEEPAPLPKLRAVQ